MRTDFKEEKKKEERKKEKIKKGRKKEGRNYVKGKVVPVLN
jgi:hypothetical protein